MHNLWCIGPAFSPLCQNYKSQRKKSRPHPYFGKLKNVKVGDTVKYETIQGTKTYEVTFVGKISSTDYSYTNEMGDNRITLITCVANQPSLRLCVQAVEIH